jgi:hypothetical protein
VLQSGFDKTPTWGIVPYQQSPPVADTVPDPFSFAAQSNAPLNSTATSGSITVTGIDAATPVSIAGGTYSLNGGAFTAVAGSLTVGATVSVRLTTSSSTSTQTCATLTIGGVAGQFCATTMAVAGGPDTTPNPFSFSPRTGVAFNSTIVSNLVAVTGIDAPAPISIAGGTYSIDAGDFGNSAGSVNAGSTVRVGLTSSGAPSTQVCATLTIGGVSAPFCATTASVTENPLVLDADDNGEVDALTDGLLIFRYLSGITGSALIMGATGIGAKRTAPTALIQYLDSIRSVLDFDGNSVAEPKTDGLLLIRYLFGMRGATLVNGALAGNAPRSEAQVEDYIQSKLP